MSDMCRNSKWCGDIASPGKDYCDSCQRELEVVNREFIEAIALLTQQHDERVIQQEERAA